MEAISNFQKDYSGEESAVVDGEVEQDSTELGSVTARSYDCIFCKRGFSTAQALGGHMNIHRKDRAKHGPIISSITPNHRQQHPHEDGDDVDDDDDDDDYDDHQDHGYNSGASPIFCYQPPIQIYPRQVPQISYSTYQPYFPPASSSLCPSTTTKSSYINNIHIHQNSHPQPYLMNSLGSPVDWGSMSLSLQFGTHFAAQHAEKKKQGGSHEEEEEEGEGLDLELRLGQNP